MLRMHGLVGVTVISHPDMRVQENSLGLGCRIISVYQAAFGPFKMRSGKTVGNAAEFETRNAEKGGGRHGYNTVPAAGNRDGGGV